MRAATCKPGTRSVRINDICTLRVLPHSRALCTSKSNHPAPALRGVGQPAVARPSVKASFSPQESDNYRRTVATPEFWTKHRNVDRYIRNLVNMPGSRIIQGLATPLSFILAVSVMLCSYETAFEAGYLPAYMPTFQWPSEQPQQMTSFAVSLLLVFRTNQSYSRWWEARKIWGGILNRVRDITTQAVVFFPKEDEELKQACGRWTIAFARSLHAHLQVEVNVKDTLKTTLSASEMNLLCDSKHRVVQSISVLAEVIKEVPLNPLQMQMMQTNVQFFYDSLGMCERIYKTPLPLTYTRHTSRFLIIWLMSMPFAGWHSYGWAIVPITMVVGALLLGIDEIGVQMEEPFAVLPLDAICTSCEDNVRQILRDQGKNKEYAKLLRGPVARGENGVPSPDPSLYLK